MVEAVPAEVTQRILEATTVPVIGIGAGAACHGQVLVVQDLLGMNDHVPRFAEPVARIGPAIEAAGREWVRRVRAREIGGALYQLKRDEANRDQQTPRIETVSPTRKPKRRSK